MKVSSSTAGAILAEFNLHQACVVDARNSVARLEVELTKAKAKQAEHERALADLAEDMAGMEIAKP